MPAISANLASPSSSSFSIALKLHTRSSLPSTHKRPSIARLPLDRKPLSLSFYSFLPAAAAREEPSIILFSISLSLSLGTRDAYLCAAGKSSVILSFFNFRGIHARTDHATQLRPPIAARRLGTACAPNFRLEIDIAQHVAVCPFFVSSTRRMQAAITRAAIFCECALDTFSDFSEGRCEQSKRWYT